MGRDSLFGERIVWEGRSRALAVPFAQKVMALVAVVAAAVTLCYAVVVAESLDVPVGGMVLFAGWCATIALAAWRAPSRRSGRSTTSRSSSTSRAVAR